MRPLQATALFLARHFFAVTFGIVAACAIWTLIYLLLFVFALFFGGGLGGPLAYPAGLVSIALMGAVGWGIFAPASGIGAVFCRLFHLPRLAAIPATFLSALILSYAVYACFIPWLTTHPMPDAATFLKSYLLYLAVPLGIYWWLIEGPGALFDTFRRWLKRKAAKSKTSHSLGKTEP